MKIKLIILLLIWPGLSNLVMSQDSFLPQSLGDSVNTPFSEINPIMAPDGKTLYFVRVNHPLNNYGTEDSQDIWFTRKKKDGTWSAAEHMTQPFNIARYNALLSINAEGDKALIKGVYNKKGTRWKKRGLSVVRKTGNIWLSPEELKVYSINRLSEGNFSSAYLTPNDSVLLLTFSKKFNSKKQDLYYSLLDKHGRYSMPKKIKNINTRYIEQAPFLSTDQKTLYFSSNRQNEFNYDIYKSERKDNSWEHWSPPELLNDTVNTKSWESFYKTNKLGSMAYFSTNSKYGNRSDIYSLKIFEEKPFVMVAGQVINNKNNLPVSQEVVYQILANGNPVDSMIFNHKNATFRLYLPLGNSYSLVAKADQFKPVNYIVDASEWKEYTEVNQNLLMEPMDYVTLQGSMLIRSTGKKIPTEAAPKIRINDIYSTQVMLNAEDGTYSVDLPLGNKYTLEVYTTKYESEAEIIDLTNVKTFQTIRQNLYVDEQKTAIITGKIFDKKTDKIIPGDIPLMLNIDESTISEVEIDEYDRTYTLELALGNKYEISAVADNYYPVIENIDLRRENEKIKIMKDLYLVPIEIGQSVRLDNIFFETAKSELKQESFEELQRVVKLLNDHNSIRIEIGGHTDNVGAAEYNLDLSSRRAESVANYLLQQGIELSRITFKGYGLTKPVADNNTELGRQINRRVEFTIIDK